VLHVRVPASCVLYVPEAQGSSPPPSPPSRAILCAPLHVCQPRVCRTYPLRRAPQVFKDRIKMYGKAWIVPVDSQASGCRLSRGPSRCPSPIDPRPHLGPHPMPAPSEPARPASRRATSGTTRNPNPNPNPNPIPNPTPNPNPNPKREQACDVWYHETISVNVMGIGGAIEAAVEKTRCEPSP